MKRRARNKREGAPDSGEGSSAYLAGRKAFIELAAKRTQAIETVFVKAELKAAPDLASALNHLESLGRLRRVSEEELDALSPDARHQGVVSKIRPLTPCSLEELLTRSLKRTGILVALDEINDPHNVGAILRAADAAGADGLILPRAHSSPLSAAVRRVSVGASEFVPVAVVPNLNRALEQCRKGGYWIIGTALGEGARPLFETELALPLVVVIGSEGAGLRKLTRDTCDMLIELPMAGNVQSLNASQAATAILYELLRRRLATP